jgi:hypothetical protein
MNSVRTENSAMPDTGTVHKTAQVAADKAGNVARTMGGQTRQVSDEAKTQMRSVAGDARQQVASQARTQNDKLADGLRQVSSELEKMAAGHEQSLAGSVVTRIADSGHQAADYLSEHGPEGVLAEAQEFARRRPAAFLATAAVTGFVVGRLGRGVFQAGKEAPSPEGQSSPAPMPASTTGTSMPASSTGTPMPAGTPTGGPATSGGATATEGGH